MLIPADPRIYVTLTRDAACRFCGRPLVIGQEVVLDAFGFCHPDHEEGDGFV